MQLTLRSRIVIANLLLARSEARQREMAVRTAIGASRSRIVRQMLTESVLLAGMGGVLGLAVARWATSVLAAFMRSGPVGNAVTLSMDLAIEPDARFLAFTALLCMVTGILFGLAPAMQSTRVDVISAMKETRAGALARRHSFWQFSLSHALVVGQIALSLMMLVAAGLFVRTLSNLQSIELGFNRENLLLFTLNAEQAGHKDAARDAFYNDLQKRFAAIPGVRGVAGSMVPLIAGSNWGNNVTIEGKQYRDQDHSMFNEIGPGFFGKLGIPLIAGRAIRP